MTTIIKIETVIEKETFTISKYGSSIGNAKNTYVLFSNGVKEKIGSVLSALENEGLINFENRNIYTKSNNQKLNFLTPLTTAIVNLLKID